MCVCLSSQSLTGLPQWLSGKEPTCNASAVEDWENHLHSIYDRGKAFANPKEGLVKEDRKELRGDSGMVKT